MRYTILLIAIDRLESSVLAADDGTTTARIRLMLNTYFSAVPAGHLPRAALDLSPAAVRTHWLSHGVADAVAAMEQTETWTVDNTAEVEAALQELAAQLTNAAPEALSRAISEASSDVVDFMGYLKSGRALLFFRWLSDTDENLAVVLVQEARDSGNDFGVILLERMRVLERQHLLSRVFSPERIALVIEILTEAGLGSDEDLS